MAEEVQDGDYHPKYVAFLDVLGFSELVRAGDADPGVRDIILGIIAVLRETLARNPRVGFQFTQFSDCIVMSADCNAYGLHAVFGGCRMLVTNLLSHGVLLRGGIAMGNLAHTEQALFGMGLLTAHRMDTSGGAPRIALDPSILAEIADYGPDRGFEEQVRVNPQDQTPMLHTLLEFEEYDPTPAVGKVILDGVSAGIARRIAFNAADGALPPPVRKKWAWLGAYWNQSVATQGILPAADGAGHGH